MKSVTKKTTKDTVSNDATSLSHVDLLSKKAWEVATGPLKSIFMTLFVLWMSGSSVHIFSLMCLIYTLMNPIRSILSVNAAFLQFEGGKSLILQKLAFILFNGLIIGCGVYKCYSVGLLPTSSDWAAAFLSVKTVNEFSGGNFVDI